MKIQISDEYTNSRKEILGFLNDFDSRGDQLGSGARNTIKIFQLEGKQVNIKSFKIPNAVNKLAYRFFRKSKAERSFQYANILLQKGVGTPFPIAYAEEEKSFLFLKSYYISEHLESELTFRDLVQDPSYPDGEEILRAFTQFTFSLHEKEIEFLDHSPGNTLINSKGDGYEFALVDLNRMNFRRLDFNARMKNFSRLTPKKEMVEIMSNEYAKLYAKPEEEVFGKMWMYTKEFQESFMRKRKLKKKLKFWKH